MLLGDPSGKSDNPTATSTTQPSGALPAISVAPPPSNAAAAAPCTKLLSALPVSLNGLASRPALSTSPYVVAWGQPAVVLRCGVGKPAGLVPGSDKLTINTNGVFYWVEPQKKQVVWTAIDRAAFVEVTVPAVYQAAPMSAISDAISRALPAVCVVDGTADPTTQCTHRA